MCPVQCPVTYTICPFFLVNMTPSKIKLFTALLTETNLLIFCNKYMEMHRAEEVSYRCNMSVHKYCSAVSQIMNTVCIVYVFVFDFEILKAVVIWHVISLPWLTCCSGFQYGMGSLALSAWRYENFAPSHTVSIIPLSV